MQDNASCHCATSIMEYLEEVGWQLLPCPAMSLDFNPIEYI